MKKRVIELTFFSLSGLIFIAFGGLLISDFAYSEKVAGVMSATTVSSATSVPTTGIDAVYQQHCGACHGAERLGAMGPALLPQNLKRLRKAAAKQVIEHGRDATQMPAFGKILSQENIDALAELIYSPPQKQPRWTQKNIDESHIIHYSDKKLGDEPIFEADLQNLFVVVELGDHHATILDGDTFDPIHRFKTRFAVHGGPKYTRDGRFVFFASRDGWISKFDIYNLKTVAEIRAGINTRNAAVSYDGQYVLVGNYLPHNLVVLSAKDLSFVKSIDTISQEGKSSRVSAVYTAPTRDSFVIALKDAPELWELPYQKGKQQFVPRKISTGDFLDDFFFDHSYKHVIGAARRDARTPAGGRVISLETGKKVADLELAGMPHLGSGISWDWQGKRLMASPNLKNGVISFINMENWQTVKHLKTHGPGFFMRSHAKSPYAWADVFFGPNKDEVHVIDKKSLEIIKTLKPAPGKTAAHVEFTKNGSHVLLSIWDNDGAVIVYDAKTLEEIKRIPMNKPSGKYNVYNKTHYEEGTSH